MTASRPSRPQGRRTKETPAARRPADDGHDPAAARIQIDALRCRIDEIDERVVALLNERSSCALDLGRLKRALGLEIYQPQREVEVLRHVRAANTGPLDGEAIARLFERIIDEARRLERLAQQAEGGES